MDADGVELPVANLPLPTRQTNERLETARTTTITTAISVVHLFVALLLISLQLRQHWFNIYLFFLFAFNFISTIVLLLLFCFSVMFYLFFSFAAVTLTAGHLSLYHSLLCATTALQIIITKTTNTTGNKCRICICTVMCWTFTTPLVQVQLLRILRQVSAALCCSRRWRPDWWFGINKTQCMCVCMYINSSTFIVIYETLYAAWNWNRW